MATLDFEQFRMLHTSEFGCEVVEVEVAVNGTPDPASGDFHPDSKKVLYCKTHGIQVAPLTMPETGSSTPS